MKKQGSSEQARKFEAAARELGCDESEERFNEALRKVASSPPAKPTTKSTPKAKKPAK